MLVLFFVHTVVVFGIVGALVLMLLLMLLSIVGIAVGVLVLMLMFVVGVVVVVVIVAVAGVVAGVGGGLDVVGVFELLESEWGLLSLVFMLPVLLFLLSVLLAIRCWVMITCRHLWDAFRVLACVPSPPCSPP